MRDSAGISPGFAGLPAAPARGRAIWKLQSPRLDVKPDPTRLTLLTCISAAGPISVSDLAAATGLHDTTVSQALRFLRAAQIVSTQRDGRIIRYLLADHPVAAFLAQP